MSIRVKHKVRVHAFRTTSEDNAYYMPDDASSEVTLDTFDKQCNANLKVAAGVTEELSFGDVDVVRGIYLEVDGEPTIKLNSSADALQLRKGNTLAGTKAKFFFEGEITKVEVIAPVGSDILGEYIVWGDLTP